MDVELPDGTVIEGVPEGLSQSALIGILSKNGYDTSWYKEPAPSFVDRVKTALTPDPNRAAMPSTSETINNPSGEFDTGASEAQEPSANAIKLPGSVMDGFIPQENASGMPIEAGMGPMRQSYYDQTRTGLLSAPIQDHAAIAQGGGQAGKVARDTIPQRLDKAGRELSGDIRPGSQQELADDIQAGRYREDEIGSMSDPDAGLSGFGKAVKFGFSAAGDSANPLIRGAGQGVAGFGQWAAGLGEIVGDMTGNGSLVISAQDMRRRWKSFENEAAGQGQFRKMADVTQAKDSGAKWLEEGVQNAANSITRQLPGLLTGATGPALTMMFMDSLGTEYGVAKAAGRPADEALSRAALFAGFEVAGEKLALDYMMPRLRDMARGVSTEKLPQFFAGLIIREVPGELTTHAGQSAVDASKALGLRPDMTLEQYFAEIPAIVRDTIIQSGLMAGGGSVMNVGINALRRASPATAAPQGGLPATPAIDIPRATPADIAAATTPEEVLTAITGIGAGIAQAPISQTLDITQAEIDSLLADPLTEAAAQDPALAPVAVPSGGLLTTPAAVDPAAPGPDAAFADNFLAQGADGRWSLSRPLSNQAPEAVAAIIDEMDRRNSQPQGAINAQDQTQQGTPTLQNVPQAAPEAGAVPNQLTPEEKPARSGKKAFESSVKYSVDTEDGGIFDATVHRTKDGAVVIQHSDGLIEHNAEFANGKTDEDLLKYSFEPIGYNNATSLDAPAAKPAGPERGVIGMKLATGQTVLTASGRETTPFPKFSTSNGNITKKHTDAVDAWLLQNARDEAKSRGDEFNARQFDSTHYDVVNRKRSASQADKDSAEEYLFGQQPDVSAPLLKPLAGAPAIVNQQGDNPPAIDNIDAPNASVVAQNDADSVNPPAKAINRIKGGKLELTGFDRDEVADTLKTAKITATVVAGKDGRIIVSTVDRAGNPEKMPIKVQNAINKALLPQAPKPKKARKFTGNLRNDVNLIAPGLYAEVARGGDGEGIDGLDMSLVAEQLRAEGFMLPETETGKDSDAVIEIIRQDIANGGGTLNEARQTAAMTEEETRKHRQEVLRLADEYGIETKRGIIPRRLEEIEDELATAIEEESAIAAKSLASVRDQAIQNGVPEADVDAIADHFADLYDADTAKDKFVRMYRDAVNAIQERIDGNQERQGRDGQGEGTGDDLPPAQGGEERPDLELTGQTADEARAEIAQQEAAEAQRQAEEDRAAAAERQARIDAEVAGRQDIAADNFTLDAQVNDKAKQKKADAKRIDEQLAGQGDIFGAINEAANQAATSPQNDKPAPTPAQMEAGNYAKGHVTLHGFDISIENPKGSERVAKDGSWRVPSMPAHYGYIKGTVGADKDHVDVFVGPNPESTKVWIINQVVPDTSPAMFDEHKVMMGFDTAADAKGAYMASFEGDFGGRVFGSMTIEVSTDNLAAKIKNGELARKKFAGPVGAHVEAAKQQEAPQDQAGDAAVQADAWWKGLTSNGRRRALDAIGSKAIRPEVLWGYLPAKIQSDLKAIIGTEKDPVIADQAGDEPNLAAAKALLAEQKAATGNKSAEVAVRGKIRKLAAITPLSDERTVLVLDNAATRLDMESLTFADARKEVGADEVRTYLDVPFASKEFAKSRGAKWDAEKKLWFATPIESGMAKGEINLSLTQYVPNPDLAAYTKQGATVAAINKTQSTGIEYQAVKSEDHPAEWNVIEKSKVGAGDTAIGWTQGADINGDNEWTARINGKPVAILQTGPRSFMVSNADANSPSNTFRTFEEAAAAAEANTKKVGAGETATDITDQIEKQKRKLREAKNANDATKEAEAEKAIRQLRQQAMAQEAVNPDSAAAAKADEDFDAAMGDLGDILGKNFRATFTPEQEQQLVPVLTRLMDAAFRKGYYKFKEAARFVLGAIQSKFGKDVSDQITLDHLQGAYIGMAGRYKDQGADKPAAVVAIESKEEIERLEDAKAGNVVYDEGKEADENGSERGKNTAQSAGDQGSGDRIYGSPGQADQGDLADQPAENVGAAGEAGASGRPGAGTPDGDVGRDGSVSEGGDAANGRQGTGRNGVADAGAGGRGRSGEQSVGGTDGSDQPGPRPVEGSRAEVANYHIADPEQLIGGTPKVRFARNRKAIEALQAITSEGRQPTSDELDAMAGYIGWGSFGQELFQGTHDRPRPKAGWEKESDWLREHLGQEAWESAQASIINAHYTDPITVSTMWDMVRQMGFNGGRVLEPSMGVGNFFGLMPRDLMARSKLAGIEMDTTTGGMAKLLYPEANIQIKPYQDSKTADNFYDLVIGNWPFAKDGPADRRYLKLSPSLHDFFFLKALDQTRPGGLVVGITSAGTMDKQGSLTRAALAEKADLVAAFRLPTGAFEKYAGTSVVTDIIILKKRETPNADVRSSGWLTTIEVDTPSGNKVKVNEYFAKNAENVLGTLNFGHGTTYGRPAMIVDRPANLEARMGELAATLPEGVFEPATTKAKTIQYVTNNTKDRQQSIITQDGKLFQVQGEYLAPLHEIHDYRVKDTKKTADREAQLGKLIDMRRKHGALIDAERDGLEDVESRRKALNDAYKAFTRAHGPLGNSEGMAIMRRVGDPFSAALAALEIDGKPATILSRATMRTKKKLENPSVRDALIMMRNEAVFIDMARVAAIAGVSEATASKDLLEAGAVFLTPEGAYDVSDVYLSGNVRRKLREAEAAAEAGMNMERNIAALKRVIPADVPYFNIEAKLGATWVPPEYYKQFIEHMLGTKSDSIEARFVVNRWKVRFGDRTLYHRSEANASWGSPWIHFDKLIAHAMGNMAVKIWGKDDDGNKIINEKASAEANEKANKIREEFGNWLWSDPVRKIEMERAYNEVMNAIAIPAFDGSFMGFEGMALQRGNSPFDMRSHQGNAVYRGLVNRRGIYAHEVGTGKTYTMGALAVESRRYGIAKKPLIFAHNANSSSVAREIGEQYPGAKVLYIDNLAPDRIDVTMRQIANDEWDAIVVPHSLISRFALKEETLMEISRHEIESLEQEAIDAANDDGIALTVDMMNDEDAMKKVRSHTAKQLVHGRNQIIKKVKEMALKSSKEGAVSFEDMGIDMIVVDEAHEFKKPPLVTRMSMKGLNKTASNQSISLMFLTDYVKKLNGGTGVHVFTGTPITNTINEIYNMMRFVMDDQMSRDGVREWDAWFNTFADQTSDVELTPAGEYEPVSRLAAFVNVPELRRMAGQYMDIVFADDMPEFKPRVTESGKTLASDNLTDGERNELLNGRTENPIGRPYKKVINDVGEMSPEQVAIFDELKRRAASFKAASKKDRKEIMLSGDNRNPVIVETAAANAGLDARLYDIEANDSPENKVNRVVKNVLAHYNEHDQATQVIFVDKGYTSEAVSRKKDRSTGQVTVTKKPRFNLVRDIVAKLTEQGIPLNQIAIVDGSVSKEKRKEIADAMNLSKIRVVIGLTDTLGVGVNMQANLRAMHHLDAPWMPGELEQRNGRGHRQGNAWNTVLEYRYITERIDGRRWQVLSIKDRFIKAFLKADDSIRVIEGDAVSLDEDGDLGNTLSDAAGDPRLLMMNKLRADVLKLENRERMHAQGIFDARREIGWLEEKIERVGKTLPTYRADFEKFKAVAKNDLVIEVGGRKFTDTEKANEAMELAAAKVVVNSDPIEIAKIWGFTITAAQPVSWRGIEYQINGASSYQMGKPTVESARATLYGVAKRIEGMEADVAEWKDSIPRMEEATKAPFARAKDLEKKRTMLADIEVDIQRNPVPAPSWLRNGAPSGTEAFVDGKPLVIEGHRYTSEGYYVTVSDGDTTRDVPYLEVMDENGLPKYEEREFEAPKIIKADDKPGAIAEPSTEAPGQFTSPRIATKFADSQEAVEWLSENMGDEGGRHIAQKILPVVRSVPIHYVNVGDMVPAKVADLLSSGSAAVAYQADDIADGYDAIYVLEGKGDTEEGLLHEALHIATSRRMVDKDAAAEFSDIAKTIRSSLYDAGYRSTDEQFKKTVEFFRNEFRSPGELISYGFSSPAFKELLKLMAADGKFYTDYRTPAELAKVNKNASFQSQKRIPTPAYSMWHRLVDAVRALFGGPKAYQEAYERAIAANAAIDRNNELASRVEFKTLEEKLNSLLDALLQRPELSLSQGGAAQPIRSPQSAGAVDTNSPGFKRWFRGSKIFDADGAPMVLYHATSKDFDTFIPGGENPAMSGPAIWLTADRESPPAAHNIRQVPGKPGYSYGNQSGKYTPGANILPLYVRMEKPFYVDSENQRQVAKDGGYNSAFPQLVDQADVDKLKAAGYDGVVLQGGMSGDEYIVFDSTQIKSAISNTGEFSDDNPSILNDVSADQNSAISRAIDRAIALELGQEVPPLRRVVARRKIGKLRTKLEAGEITESEFVSKVEQLHADMEEAFQSRQLAPHKGRTRGADWIRQKLLEAKRRGDISEEAADFAEWFVIRNPALVDGLGISLRTKEAGAAAGNYNPMNRVMTLFKGKASDTTAVHEILHHMERMMPADMQEAIRLEWIKQVTKELTKAQKAGDQQRIAYFEAVLAGDQKKATEILTGEALDGLNSAVQDSAYGLPDQSPVNRTLDAATLRDLRREAAGLEQPEKGKFLTVTADGLAVTYGEPRTKIPASFARFAAKHGLTLSARRVTAGQRGSSEGVGKALGDMSVGGGVRGTISNLSQPMPIEYRESGAAYFGESGKYIDRTGRTRYDLDIGNDYRFLNPSEFWAVSMTETVGSRFNARDSVWARSLQWLKEALEHIKAVLGLNSKHPMIKALDAISKGDGSFASKEMLGSSEVYAAPRQQPIPGAGSQQVQPSPTRQTPAPLQGGTPGNQATWQQMDDTKLDDVIRVLQDKHIDTKRAVQAIQAAGRQVADKWDPYLQETLFHGRAAKRTLEFVETELTPLAKDLAMRGLTMDELDEYLHARHAEEANDAIAQRNPGMPDSGSGMATQDALNYLANLDPGKKRNLVAAAALVDAIIDKTRQTIVAYGLESQETIDAWTDAFDHYVPLMREGKDGNGHMGIGQGFSIKGKETKSRTGSTRKVVDILANIAMQRERAIVRGEKNRVAMSLFGLAKLNPNADFWTTDKIPVIVGLNPATGLVEAHPDPLYKSRDNVIIAKFPDGKGGVVERAVIFKEDNEQAMNAVAAMKNLDVAQLEGLLGGMASITRYFAAVNTQWNPVFGVTNFVRDFQDAALNLSSTPIAGHRAAVLKGTFGALAGIYTDTRKMRKGAPGTSTWAQLWEEFQHEGGQTGYRDLYRTSEDRAKQIARAIDPNKWMDGTLGKIFTAGGALRVPLKVAQSGATWLFDWLSDYNEAMENAVRLSAYKVGRDQGMSKQRAAEMAKGLTVNFNRKGQVTQHAGMLYAFFNASVQGTGRIAQTVFTMQGNDAKTIRLSRAGQAIVGGGILLGSMQALMLAAAGFGDDDPPEFVRERNLIIPWKVATLGMVDTKKYTTIPMPLGYMVLPNIGRVSTEFAMGGFKNPAKHALRLMGIMADAFNPVGGNGTVAQMVSPTALDPLVAISENKDWTKKPIAKAAYDKTTPGHKLWKDTASTPSKIIAEAINSMSGGTKHVAGTLSPTPDQIDYLFGQVTGGVGRELSKLEQSVMATARGEDLPPHKIPLVGRFYGDSGAQTSQGAAFYNNVNRINEYEAQIKGLRKEGKGAEAAQFIRDNPEARLVMRANYAERQVQKLRKEKHDLVDQGASRERVKALEERIKGEMLRFNEAVKASKQREKEAA